MPKYELKKEDTSRDTEVEIEKLINPWSSNISVYMDAFNNMLECFT